MVAILKIDDGFFLGNLLFVVLVSAATRFGTTNGQDILTSGGNGMNQSLPFKPRNLEESFVMPKLRKYIESIKEDLTTASQSDVLGNDTNKVAQRTSTAKSDSAEVNDSRLHTQNEHNGTTQDYSEQTVTEKIVIRTIKPESVITTKVEEIPEKVNKNEDKDFYEDTDLNAETSVESNAHQDKSDRSFSLSDIDGLFPDITEDQIPKDIKEDDKILDSYTTINYDDNDAPSEKLKQEIENLKIGTEDTAASQDNLYLSATTTQGVNQLSLDSISSASDQISKFPSSHLTTAEDVMYIDLELDDYTHVTRPRQYSYQTKYSFSESDVYDWSSSSRHSSITYDTDPISKPPNVRTDKDSISPTRVIKNVPSYHYTQTSLALPKTLDGRNTVYSSSIKNEQGVRPTDYLSQNHKSQSIIESSFRVDSTSNTAINTLTETSQIFFKTEIDETKNIIESINSTENYIHQLLHPLKTSQSGLSSQNMEESTYTPYKSVNYIDVINSEENGTSIDAISGSKFGSANAVTQDFTYGKEALLLTSVYGPTAVKPQASSLEPILESELITSNAKVTANNFKEGSISPSFEVTASIQDSKLKTPIMVTTSLDYPHELATVTPSFEQIGESTSKPKSDGTTEEQVSIHNTLSGDYPEKELSSVTPTLEIPKPDFTRTPNVQVTPSKPCDWSIPTVSPTENAQEENEEDMNEMKLPIYVYMHLSHAWPDFCNKQQDIRSHFSHVFAEGKERKVEPRQIFFAGIKPCNRSRIQHHHRGVKVYVYTVDTEGNYSENLTTELELKLQNQQRRRLSAERETEYEICEVAIYRVPERPTSQVTEASSRMSSSGMIAAISISAIAGICLILMFTMLLILKQRQDKDHNSASSSDSYSMNSFAARGGSGRRKRPRLSIRSFLNQAFDEPEMPNHPLNFNNLSSVLQNKSELEDEFKNIPMDVPRSDTLPQGAEIKNRYANVIPVPETRVPLSSNGEQPGYINANFVKGYGGRSKTYIACQAPLDETIEDFWRMVWEQQSRVVVMLTRLEENGVSRCAPYFPENTVDCHRLYGDFQVTLLEKDVRENFVKSSIRLHDLEKNLFRDVVHVWYTAWPPQGVPEDAGSFMGCILELRTLTARNSGPVVVHCSPGTGRTGTYIATDICMHEYQESRCVDILRCVARLRQDRSGAVQTFDQYLFIHEVLHEYALKLGTQSHRPSLMSLVSLKLSHQER